MKKIMLLATTILLIFTVSIDVFAENTGVAVNPPKGYTIKDRIETERQEKIKDEKLFQLLENETNNSFKLDGLSDGEYYSVPVTYNSQITDYWCGPASIRQSLSFHKEKSGSSILLPTLDELARKSEITEDGAWTANLKEAINEYCDTYDFDSYVAGDINDKDDSLYVFENRIKGSLKNELSAPVLLIERSKIKRYKGKKEGRHYITVSGYSYEYETGEKRIKVVDPDKRRAYRGYHWDDLYNPNEDKCCLFRAVSEADSAVDNKVMLY